MTSEALIVETARLRIRLEARGDKLVVDAPANTLTADLRAELVRHKLAILELLTMPFVSLKGGLVLPLPAVLLALDLERRGFRMSFDADQQFQIAASTDLTDEDRAAIRRWRLHLAAILAYEANEGDDRRG